MMPSAPHNSAIGTGDAMIRSTAHLRQTGHASLGPTGVAPQSNCATSSFILWLADGRIGRNLLDQLPVSHSVPYRHRCRGVTYCDAGTNGCASGSSTASLTAFYRRGDHGQPSLLGGYLPYRGTRRRLSRLRWRRGRRDGRSPHPVLGGDHPRRSVLYRRDDPPRLEHPI